MNDRRPIPPLTVIVAIALCLTAAGCGQKGNLYLPNQKKKVPATQAPPVTPAQPGTQAQPDAQK